jgi:uncharacterized membrane protein YqhA
MLRFALSLRYVMLVASLGAALGALVILWEGCAKLFQAGRAIWAGGEGAGQVVNLVMGATDAFLFAMVLVIFAYAIAFGFVIDLAPDERERLPSWMRIASVGELKHTLVGVILVYLVVDFATNVAGGNHSLAWEQLVLPISVFLIAGALRLLSMAHPQKE